MELPEIFFSLSSAFKHAMRELVRFADQKKDISNARVEAVRCAREAIAMAKADEEIARRLKSGAPSSAKTQAPRIHNANHKPAPQALSFDIATIRQDR